MFQKIIVTRTFFFSTETYSTPYMLEYGTFYIPSMSYQNYKS
jgi:hypothetical protein